MKNKKNNALTMLTLIFTVGIVAISLQSKAQINSNTHQTMAGYVVR